MPSPQQSLLQRVAEIRGVSRSQVLFKAIHLSTEMQAAFSGLRCGFQAFLWPATSSANSFGLGVLAERGYVRPWTVQYMRYHEITCEASEVLTADPAGAGTARRSLLKAPQYFTEQHQLMGVLALRVNAGSEIPTGPYVTL